jgi:hypothetical protein
MRPNPVSLFRDSVSVETYSGDSAYGALHADSVAVQCKVSAVQNLVRNAEGVEVVSSVTLYVKPEDAALFTPESLVTVAGNTSVVLTVAPQARPGETVYAKVMCA